MTTSGSKGAVKGSTLSPCTSAYFFRNFSSRISLPPLTHFIVQEELAQGRLVNIAPRPVSGQRAYSLIYPEHKAELPALQAFSTWLQGEASPV